MRRSSSTTNRCGASSGSATAGPAINSPPVSARPARAIRPGNEAQHALAAFLVDHRGEEGARCLMRVRPEAGERARDALGLQPGEFHRELLALRRNEEKAMAAVVRPFLLHHIALIDELLEHPSERLLGDAQGLQEVGDLHARIAIDEMQHAVVRPPEAEFLQDVIRIRDKVPVGKEQKLDQIPDRLALGRPRNIRGGRRARAGLRKNYVSHVDIFLSVCYQRRGFHERIVLGITFRPGHGRFATREFEPAEHSLDPAEDAKCVRGRMTLAPPRTCPMNVHQKIVFSCSPTSKPVGADARAALLKDPGFGRVFTDHMVTIRWTQEGGWQDAQLRARAPISLDPAAAVLHYGQEIFEGLKAYRRDDGSIALFRPEQNARRFNASAARMALPELPEELFLGAIDELVKADLAWVPGSDGSLYLRPFLFATEAFLGVRPSQECLFMLIASSVGSYFKGGEKPVTVWLTEHYTRAADGGTGA